MRPPGVRSRSVTEECRRAGHRALRFHGLQRPGRRICAYCKDNLRRSPHCRAGRTMTSSRISRSTRNIARKRASSSCPASRRWSACRSTSTARTSGAASTPRPSSPATAARRSAASTSRSSAIRDLLREHHVVFISGVNEDLGATAVYGCAARQPLPEAEVRRRARHVVRQGARRRPHRRHLQARELRRRRAARAACSRWPATIRCRSRPRCPRTPRSRSTTRSCRCSSPATCRRSSTRPSRLRALALLRALGRLQDRHQRRRRDRHRRGLARTGS